MIFPTRVAGIPCKCKVLAYYPPTPMEITGPGMGDANPPEPPQMEFRLLNSRGNHIPWLERKLTQEDYDALVEQYLINHIW